MTLNDLVRQRTHRTQADLKSCEERIRELGSERRGKLQERDGIRQQEIDAAHEKQAESRQALQETERRISELEREIEALQAQAADHQAAVGAAQDEVENAAKARTRAESQAHKLQREIDHDVSYKVTLQERLRSDRREALQAYLQQFESRLGSYLATAQETSERLVTRRKFDEARNEDPEVMSLWEARIELQRFVQASSVPGVGEALRQQLREIEDQIEARFPGALASEEETDVEPEIEEVFFCSPSEGKSQIFIPVSEKSWRALRSGDRDPRALAALMIVWALGKGLQLDQRTTKFTSLADWFVLEVDRDLSLSTSPPTISLPLPGRAAVPLALSELPHEIEEALTYEDPDS